MIRNKIGDQDVPMMLSHDPLCALYNIITDEVAPEIRCICKPKLVIDERQLRLEHKRCPDCSNKLSNKGQKRGWYGCICCGRAWRRRRDGRYDEQLPLTQSQCPHWAGALAGFAKRIAFRH